MLFAVLRRDKPDSLSIRLPERPRHLEYLETVLDKIRYGGALTGRKGEQIGSRLFIEIANEAEADALPTQILSLTSTFFASTSV